MPTQASYLVCHNQVQETKRFLDQFFQEDLGPHNHEGWVTFQIPQTNFLVNLIEGYELALTQNMVFEIYCDSLTELQQWASRFGLEVRDFLATRASQHYRYYFIELIGPKNICKMEISFSEDLN